MRGGRFMRGGFGPRMPPPESEETVFKKYDKTPKGDHPSKNHPLSKLNVFISQKGWPVPQYDLINEKIINQRRTKHGNANTMLYTYKITVYPGKGQVQPRVYFGSGPTKKDAKFACGSVAWSNLEGGLEPSADAQAQADASKAEAVAGGANISGAPTLDPTTQDYNPMQMAVTAISDMNQRKRMGVHTKEGWLDSVGKNLQLETKLKKFMELPADLKPPTQLIQRKIKDESVEVKKEEGGDGKEERKRKRKSRWGDTEEEPEVKKEPVDEDDKPYLSRSASREKEPSSPKKEKERERSKSRNSSRRSGERDSKSRDDRASSSKDRDRDKDRGNSSRRDDGDRKSSSRSERDYRDERGSSSRSGRDDRERSSRSERDYKDERGSSSRSGRDEREEERSRSSRDDRGRRDEDMWRHDKYDEADSSDRGRDRGRDGGRRDRDRDSRSGRHDSYDDYRYKER